MRSILANTRSRLLTEPLESICDSFFVLYALWTLTWISAYLANLTLAWIQPIFFFLFPLSVLALGFKHSPSEQLTPNEASKARRDTLIVLVFVMAGILLTLTLHRPDSDDELYLGMAFSLLANADQPIQQLPGYASGLYASGFASISAYEPLKAMVSYSTGLPLLHSYYLLVPSLMAAMTVIVTYRLLRKLVPDGWVFGLLFFFVVMLAWGDVHRTYANFGFVRMFQGKSVLVSVIVPALFLYFFLAQDKTQTVYHWLLLAAALVSGVGASRGGLVIGPLVFALLGLASIDFRTFGNYPRAILMITGSVAIALLLLAYHFGFTLMNPSQLVYTRRGEVSTTTNLEMIEFTMGDGFRGMFLLLCVGMSFLFVKDNRVAHTYRSFLLIFFMLLLIPWTSDFFAKTLQIYLSWRWLWVVPVPVLASVGVGGFLAELRGVTNSAIAIGIFLVLAAGFTAVSPRRVLSAANNASIRWPDAKLDGHSVYLKPYGKAASIKNGRLHVDCYDRPRLNCQE